MSMIDTSFDFTSRRSVVVCKNGCVASTNPLASQAGLDILKAGGNAVDAAVAAAAALNVTEPMSTGLGGDAFCMFYDNATKTVKGLNGSGRASSRSNLSEIKSKGYDKDKPCPPTHALCVTVPGAASAWVDSVEKWGSGKLSLSTILKPAIEMAETGFPVQDIASRLWYLGAYLLQAKDNVFGKDMLLNGRAPKHGEIMRNPCLGQVMKEMATNGKKGFYEGRIAKSIVETVNQHGGLMTVEDLAQHESTVETPINTVYKGCKVWEMPPNGQGMTALMALNILEGFDLQAMGHNSSMYLHHLIESLRLAFADSLQYCADPSQVDIPLVRLLSKEYAAQRRGLIRDSDVIPTSKLNSTLASVQCGSDTVYLSTADKDGNACSFINSNFEGFGTGLVPEGCGFTLQNRGSGFSLDPSHLNVLAARKRPYHTIIPSMVTDAQTDELLMSYGVMGAYMQPQGHVQVLLNMLEFGFNPQEALDLPRICLGPGYNDILTSTKLEKGIPNSVVSALSSLGHNVHSVSDLRRSAIFGRGQVISRGGHWWNKEHSQKPFLYWAGSDPRGDGQVAAY